VKVTHDECVVECTRFGINALNQNCKSEHKSLETFEESKKVIPLQVQALDCYQNERHQDESETKTMDTADVDAFAISGVRTRKFCNPDPIRNFFIKSISNPYPKVKNCGLRYPIQIRNHSLSCTIAYIFGSVYP